MHKQTAVDAAISQTNNLVACNCSPARSVVGSGVVGVGVRVLRLVVVVLLGVVGPLLLRVRFADEQAGGFNFSQALFDESFPFPSPTPAQSHDLAHLKRLPRQVAIMMLDVYANCAIILKIAPPFAQISLKNLAIFCANFFLRFYIE